MPDSSTEETKTLARKAGAVHYTFWGIQLGAEKGRAASLCEFPGTLSGRHEFVTCEECKAHPTYRNHVFQREIAFDGNFTEWQDALKAKFFKGEATND